MGRITLLGFVFGCFVIILSGCTPAQKKNDTEKLPLKQESQQETTRVMITTGTRVLPNFCNPGDLITVKINIIPASQISGVIVTEKIPEGWKLVKSEPQFSRIEPNNLYKWLQWAQQVAPFTIVYQVQVPDTAKGKFTFDGKLTTFREGDIPITGNNEIIVK
ncbi:MAG: hypothetical protein N2115_05980 [bacterium]|nr:hypothetical protein [bacterium]